MTLTATASDTDGTIAKVTFYRGETEEATDDTSPYTYTYEEAEAGTHIFYAVAEDNDGATTTSETVEVAVNALPTVSLTASSSSINEGESVTVRATASDTDGSIASVKFYRNDTLVATDTSSPYTHTYTNAAAGTHSFAAIATDDDGATTTSETLSVTVNDVPTVLLSASSTSIIQGDSVTVTATVSDTDGSIASVKFYHGGSLVATVTSSPYTYTYANASLGSHDFQAVATDDDEATGTSSTVTVTVNLPPNLLPDLSIALSSASIDEGDSVTVTATARDPDGAIVNVKFYRNGTLVATVTNSPYSYTYSNAATGSHSFYALATDNQRRHHHLEHRERGGERSAHGLVERLLELAHRRGQCHSHGERERCRWEHSPR